MARTCRRSISVGAVCCVEIGRFGEVNENPEGIVLQRFTVVEYVEMLRKSNTKWGGLVGVWMD